MMPTTPIARLRLRSSVQPGDQGNIYGYKCGEDNLEPAQLFFDALNFRHVEILAPYCCST